MAVFAKHVHHHKNSIKDIRRKSNYEVLGAILPNSVKNSVWIGLPGVSDNMLKDWREAVVEFVDLILAFWRVWVRACLDWLKRNSL
ncbi:hypothetical protein KY290_032090 [Solanum tuberosum]|uniref:Uncharacterized protein n=1 Tax=Solanum tuberosum TaxID=4113 RepID=A0ABQ7UB73_SOLTU|nr:hypothetical protein KY290_032090 [Solanum tuberosum]